MARSGHVKTELRHMHHRYRGYPSCINWMSLVPAASTGAGGSPVNPWGQKGVLNYLFWTTDTQWSSSFTVQVEDNSKPLRKAKVSSANLISLSSPIAAARSPLA